MIGGYLLSSLEFLSPLLLAASGALLPELSGKPKLSIEGEMLAGAFAAAFCLALGLHPIIALAASAVIGSLSGITLSLCLRRLGADPVLASLAFNLILQALSSLGAKLVFGSGGVSRLTVDPAFHGPGFSGIALALVVCAWAILWGFSSLSRAGLRLRAIGLDEEGARRQGLALDRPRDAAYAISGALSGIGGALMCLALRSWAPGISSGRGWLAVAAVYVGRRGFPGVALASLCFALAEALAVSLQALPGFFREANSSLPFACTLLAMLVVGLVGRRRPR